MGNRVYKFGGASVKDAKAIKNVYNILSNYQDDKLIVIVSAMGKTTNALEKVVDAYTKEDPKSFELLDEIKKNHFEHISQLELGNQDLLLQEVNDLFVEVEWILEEEFVDTYDYIYDQIVSIGELVSTKIIYYTLLDGGLQVEWLDARDCILTDNNYRNARVDWKQTEIRIQNKVERIHQHSKVIVTQGFIGSSSENFTTTLAKEGSDFTAAIFSYCTDAESMHIWKDVNGILTADPKLFKETTRIDTMTYREAIEMTYFGAKVIHPKTIKPIQNKSIPLHVRPFDDPNDLGTCISDKGPSQYPPIIVFEKDQTLLKIKTKDFSFIAEDHLSDIFKKLAELRIKVNIMRNSAVSFTLCVKNISDKIQTFVKYFSESLSIDVVNDLELITIRHYDQLTIDEMTKNREVVFEEFNDVTRQMVVKRPSWL